MSAHSIAIAVAEQRHAPCKTPSDSPVCRDAAKMLRIKLLEPSRCDMYLTVHRDLLALVPVKGKHRHNIRWELALLWKSYMRHGEFSYSTDVADYLYNTRYRSNFVALIDSVSELIKNYSTSATAPQTKTRRFTLDGVSPKCATYSSSPRHPGMVLETGMGESVCIPAEWLTERYKGWCDYCNENDLPQNLDCDARTKWGSTILSGIAKTELPADIGPDEKQATIDLHRALTEIGVPAIVARKHGRISYHPTSGLAKTVRRKARIGGDASAEVDLHACYTAILVSKLPESEEKTRAIEELQTGAWYEQFEDAHEEWMWILSLEGVAYRNSSRKWMVRVDDNPAHDVLASDKIEYQRQCLFWKDNRPESNPLRDVLRQLYPALCDLIEQYRGRLSAREFSHVLTHAEGAMMIDDLVPALARRKIEVISNHDGVIVPRKYVAVAAEIAEMVAYKHLGFVPYIATK